MAHYVLPGADARLDYDKDSGALYVAVAGSKVFRDGDGATVTRTVTVNAVPMVNLDYDKNGKLVGVEMLL